MLRTMIDIDEIPPIHHQEAHGLAETAYQRFADLLSTVQADQWQHPTDCEGWTVRDMAGHMVGAMRSAASVREMISQQREISRRVKREGGIAVDHMTALQIERTASLTSDELVAECRDLVKAAALGRKRTPAPLRRLVGFDVEMGPIAERWKLGYLVDVILTRDTWMHRVDLARAIGGDLTLTADHDGRIVADVTAEWARRHGEPFTLTLTGPAGGSFTAGSGGPAIEMDAVEFCRVLSGRAEGTGLLAQAVPF